MANVAIDTAASGTTTLIAAPTSPAFIRVLGYCMYTASTNTAKLLDSVAGELMGPLVFSAQGGAIAPVTTEGWFDLQPGSALQLNNGTATQLSGHVQYAIKG
jgi:hypothetical protein